MMFASLGQTSGSKGWGYILTLQIVLATIGMTGCLSHVAKKSAAIQKFCHFVLTILCGVLLGFYYGGVYTDNNSQAAVIMAIAMSIIFYLLDRWQPRIASAMAMTIASVCAYGFALMRGVAAINLIASSLFVTGIIWACICFIYLGLTANNLAISFQTIRR